MTTTGVSGSPLIVTDNTATGTLLGLFGGGRGGGITAVNSTAALGARGTAGGVYRLGGTMTTTSSPITANNCVGSNPAVPTCTG